MAKPKKGKKKGLSVTDVLFPGVEALAKEASGITRAVKKALSRGTEGYGGEGWKAAKRSPRMEVRHPESRRGSKD